jgi:Probable cobalt transporter subunit (CbtA)
LRLSPRIGGMYAVILGGLGYLAVMLVATALLPSFDEVPGPLINGAKIVFPGFPATTLASFRLGSIGNQALLWILSAIRLNRISRRDAVRLDERRRRSATDTAAR